MKRTKMAIAALCALAFASSAFATIQPTRVGPVSQYGALQSGKNSAGEGRIYGSVQGVKDGAEVQVRGMSLTWSQYWPYGSSFYGSSFIDTLVGSWNVELVRSAMGVVPPWGHGSYMTRPEYFESQMDTVVQAAIQNDVYVLIDWHSEGGYYNCIHKGTKPKYEFNDNKTCFTANDAAAFFGRMAERYGKYPHVIFEIYNEPVSESWADLKAYADTVISAIRKHSKNLVIVGTPMWSSMAGDAVAAPVQDDNVAYTYHFYANLHQTSSHLSSSNKAMEAGLSVFVTEWGGIDEIFTKETHKTELEKFLAWTNEKKISCAKWDVEKPFLENNDVDNYIKENILPAKTTYQKNLNWETGISDKLPNLITYGAGTDIPGKWSSTSDIDDYGDEQGDKGNSTFTDNSTETTVKMDNMKLDTVGTGFDYAPYIRAEYAFDGEPDLSKCKMVSYRYKGANHQFILYYDWNASIDVFGEGAWDYPFVEMPYAPEWETVYVDLGWMMSNGWQAALPLTPVLSAATAFRFNVTNDFFDTSLWIDNIKCIESVEGYTPVKIPDNTNAVQTQIAKANYRINTNGLNIVATGIKNGTHYSLSNILGQTLRSGTANASSFKLSAPQAGRYILRIGNSVHPISIK